MKVETFTMDSDDPAILLYTKILSLEPDYCSQITCYLLLQDLGKGELMRLSREPESVLKSIILKVKSKLGISSNNLSSSSSTLTSPFPLNPTCRPPINGRLGSNSNGFMDFSRNSPSYPSSSSTTPWSLNNIVNPSNGNNGVSVTDTGADAGGSADLLDDQFLRDRLSFLDDSCFSGETEDVVDPRIPLDYSVDNGETHLHRRCFSVDASFGSGNNRYNDRYNPSRCVHFSRGICKNGDSCRFSHVGYSDNFDGNDIVADSPRLASQIQHHAQRDGELSFDAQPDLQVYLTFGAHNIFTAEDVATYFSHFGTVRDVRIPYQTNRTYGFVLFAHPETVTALLARGNPRYICASRVFVKPYKVKREVLEKKQQQLLELQIELEYFSPGSTPSEIDPREGSKIYERSEMMRRKMEQADFVRAIEFERRRFTNLQLPNSITPNHYRSFSVGSPGYNSSASNQKPEYQFEHTGVDALEVDHASELYPYSVINRMSVINNYSNGAEEVTDKSEMIRRKMEQAIEFERRRISNLQLPNSTTPNHHRNFSVGSPGYFSSSSNQSHYYQFAHTGVDALEVDHASELYPYSVINRMSVNNNYANGAEEGTDKSEMIRRKMKQAIEFERRRITNLQLPNSTTPNHHRNFSVGSPGYFSSSSHDYQSAYTDALEVVDDASELLPYPVINRMSVNNNHSNGAEEGTDTGSPLELALPSNLFPSAYSTSDHKTDDSAKTDTKVGASSTNGHDHKPPVMTNNFMQ